MDSKHLIPTAVWWNINQCPVPDGYNARSVCLRIEDALSQAGYYPVTITAIGNLKHTLKKTPDVLRDLYSGGISLKHVLRGFDLDPLSIIFEDMLDWIRKNPPPAAIMLISGGVEDLSYYFSNLEDRCTILRAYPSQKGSSQFRAWDWEHLLGTPENSVFYPSGQRESGWDCTLCEAYSKIGYRIGFAGLTFEGFTTHLMSRDHALIEIYSPDSDAKTSKKKSIGEEEERVSIENMPKQEDAKVTVWWDINSCPVPNGYDARTVRPIIESALKKSGYSCPLTITAIGNLKLPLRQIPDLLPAISSTGILLQHVPSGFRHIWSVLVMWRMENPPPATLMLISSSGSLEDLTYLWGSKDTILRVVPQQASSLPTSNHHWVWESLLEDSHPHVFQEKCSESDWVCTQCELNGQNIEDFTTHLKSRDHALSELNEVSRPVTRKMSKFMQSEEMSGEEEEEEEQEEGEGEGQWERTSLDGMLSKIKGEEDDRDRKSI